MFGHAGPLPVVTTGPPAEALQTTATLTGSIEPAAGFETSCRFIVYGPSYSTAPCVPAGPFSSFNEVQAELTGLQRGTTYGYRLQGTTSTGSVDGAEEHFTTQTEAVQPPAVTIEPVTAIGENSATFNGKVNPNEVPTTYHFEYSTDGVSWIALKEESAGEGASEVPVTQTVTGLAGHATYHVRLVATNSCGVGITGCGVSTSTEETFPTAAGPPRFSPPAPPISRPVKRRCTR